MLENYSASNSLLRLHLDDFEALSSKYESLLPLCSARISNVLAALERRYGDEYKVLSVTRNYKLHLQESMRLLEEFIHRKQRFSTHNEDDEEESRLYRFVENRHSTCAKEILLPENTEQRKEFEEKYREYYNYRPYKARPQQ